MNYLESLKRSFFAKGCAPTFSVHLYTLNVMRRLFWNYIKKDKKVLLFMFADITDCLPNKFKKLNKEYEFGKRSI